jgi:hypothetical protein
MIESQVRELFTEIADAEPAGSRVDLQFARRRGRARLRWRRACVAGTSVLAAAAVAALALTAGSFRPGAGPPAAGPAAPRQFNPLIPNVSFGWLPAGESLGQGGVRQTDVYLAAGPQGLPGWGLSVYARGRCHQTSSPRGVKCSTEGLSGVSAFRFSERAPAVGGHRAFWADDSLVWQYARGGWAALSWPGSAPGVRTPRHETVMRHREAIKIAEHVRFGAATPPLVFPARLTGLTSQWRISDVRYSADSGVLSADSYVLTTGSSRFHPHVGDLGVWTDAPYIMVHPSPRKGTCTPHDPASQNTSEIINGYRVVLKRMHIGGFPVQELCGAHAAGLWFDIEVFGAHPTIDVASLFRDHMRLLGTNPANWTSNPIG